MNSFVGLCQGNLFLFNDLNELNSRCLHLFLQLSSKLYGTILNKNKSFEYLSRTYSLVDSNEINIFSTISPSTMSNFSSLKSDIIVDYRSVTLSKPDYCHVFIAHLIESGFHHAFQLSKRFLNLLCYTINQSLTENLSQHGKTTFFCFFFSIRKNLFDRFNCSKNGFKSFGNQNVNKIIYC